MVLFCDRNLELLLPARSNWIKRYCLLCCSACRLDKGGVLEWAKLVEGSSGVRLVWLPEKGRWR